MKPSTIAAICCLLGGWLLIGGGDSGGDERQPVGDILEQCYVADRAAKIELLREWATVEGSDEQRADWWNERQDAARQKVFSPWLDELAKAARGADSYSRAKCHEYARDTYNSRIMAEKFVALYEKILSGERLHDTPPRLKPDHRTRKLPWN